MNASINKYNDPRNCGTPGLLRPTASRRPEGGSAEEGTISVLRHYDIKRSAAHLLCRLVCTYVQYYNTVVASYRGHVPTNGATIPRLCQPYSHVQKHVRQSLGFVLKSPRSQDTLGYLRFWKYRPRFIASPTSIVWVFVLSFSTAFSITWDFRTRWL